MAEPRLLEMLDLAIGTPEVGAVNFRLLYSLLRAVLERLPPVPEGERAALAPPVPQQEGGTAQGTGEQLSGAGTTSGTQLTSVATDVGEMKEKLKENESGISKALDEIGGVKAAQSRMGEDIQALREALGLLQDKLQEAAGQLWGPHHRRVMDTDEESSGSQSPSSESTRVDVDLQRGGRSALGPEGPGGQAVPVAGEGTLGTQPGSLGTQAESQRAAATTEKGAGAPSDGTRGSPDAGATTPGTRPGSPGIKAPIPGMHTGSPGIESYAPGTQPGGPGMSPLQEGAVPVGTPGSSSVPLHERSVSRGGSPTSPVSHGGQLSSLDGQGSDLQDEKEKISQLEDAFGTLGVSRADWEVDGSAQGTLPPGSMLQEMKKELQELKELGVEQMMQDLKELGVEQMMRDLKELGVEQMMRDLKELGLEQMMRDLKELGLEQVMRDLKELDLEQVMRDLKELDLEQVMRDLKELDLEQVMRDLKELDLEQMKRELKELAEQQEITKATLQKFMAEMAELMLAQQEKQKALEGPRQEQAACPTCSGDTRAQVGQLLRRYENLKEVVDALMSRRAGAKVFRQLPSRSQQDEELLKRIQAMVTQMQGDHEKLSSIVDNILDESHQKQQDTKVLFQSLEKLEKEKANKEDLELGIDVKADKSALASKVNHSEFDAWMERLKEMFQEMLSRVSGQEQVQQQLSEELATKLDRLELGPFRQQLEGHWESILEQLRGKALQAEEDDAAGLRKLLLAHFHCLSCDRPLDVRVPGPRIVTIPSSPPLLPHFTGQTPSILKPGQDQQDRRREPPAEIKFPTVPRSCGGRHTITTPLQRLQCLRTPQQLQPLLLPNKYNMVDLLAKDHHILRGRMGELHPVLRGKEEPGPGKPRPAPHKPKEPKPAEPKADGANRHPPPPPGPPRDRSRSRSARLRHVLFKM